MDQSELDLARISQRLVVASMQAVAAYNQAQNQLDLERVLDGERLSSPAGIAQSRSTVLQLAALTQQHKAMFSKFMTGATEQLVAVASQLTEDRRASFSEALMRSINYNLSVQAKFYAGRERWIEAATQALALAEQHDGDIWLEGGELVVADTDLLEQLQFLVAQIDEVRESEVALFHERQERIASSMKVGTR